MLNKYQALSAWGGCTTAYNRCYCEGAWQSAEQPAIYPCDLRAVSTAVDLAENHKGFTDSGSGSWDDMRVTPFKCHTS